MSRKASSTLAATAVAFAALGVASPASAQSSPPPATGGSVPATVSVADDSLCLTVEPVALDFGTVALFDPAEPTAPTPAGPAYLIDNCGNYTSQLWARVTEAVGDGGAVWTPGPHEPAPSCTTPDVFATILHRHLSDGGPQLQHDGWMAVTLQDQPFHDLTPGGLDLKVTTELRAPCIGSSGAGQTMSFTYHYTITAPA